MLKPLFVPKDSAIVAQPTWRWERAVAMSSGQASLRADDDRATVTAYTFWSELKVVIGDEDAERLVWKKHADLYKAYLLYANESPVRWAVEAYIVAGCTVYDVAKYTSQDPGTIAWFEDVFFDVRQQSKNKSFVTLCLVPECSREKFADEHPDMYWKLVGAVLGAEVLHELIERSAGLTSAADLDAWIKAEARRRLASKVSGIRITGDNVEGIARMTGVTAEADTGPASNAAIVEFLGHVTHAVSLSGNKLLPAVEDRIETKIAVKEFIDDH